MSTKKEEKVATHLTEEVILVKSNCGDMMSTKRGKKVATDLTEKVVLDKSNCSNQIVEI